MSGIGIVQALAFALLVGLAMIGANSLDQSLSACAAPRRLPPGARP